jgi:hypothetical protein
VVESASAEVAATTSSGDNLGTAVAILTSTFAPVAVWVPCEMSIIKMLAT